MTLTETTNTEPLLRQGVFVCIASFAHRRRWLVLTRWVAVLFGVWTAVSVTCDDYRNSFARPCTASQQAGGLPAEHGAARERRVTDVLDTISALPGVSQVRSLYGRAISEEWVRSGHRNPFHAVREGLAHTGSMITAADAIMIAIFVDAVIIRCLIVPAAMELTGRRAWWLPAPLARLLPKVEL